jgi:hypothetical protein
VFGYGQHFYPSLTFARLARARMDVAKIGHFVAKMPLCFITMKNDHKFIPDFIIILKSTLHSKTSSFKGSKFCMIEQVD